MSKCINEEIGAMLHAYELGMLSEEDSNRVEVHLLECPHCNQMFLEFLQAARALRSDTEVRPVLEKLNEKTTSQGTTDAAQEGTKSDRRRTKVVRYLMAAAAVIVLLVLKPWNLQFESDDPVQAAGSAIAVMPFEYVATPADTGRMAEVVVNLLITDLAESRFLEVIPGKQIVNVSRYLGSKDSSLDAAEREQTALERFGTRWILNGTIVQLEPQIVVTIQITDLIDHRMVQSLREIGDQDESVFAVVDRVAARIREGLLTPVEAQSEFDPALADVTTHSAEAYRWYLEGVELYGLRHIDEAEDAYRRAVACDSTFAMGWYCLAFHGVPNAVENAVKYSDQASHKEKLYIYSLAAQRQGDEARAESLLKELVEHYPNEKIAWMELAYIAWENLQYDSAVHYLKQSLLADPLYVDALDLLAYVYNDMGQFDSALATINEAVSLEPEEPNPYDSRGEILAANGKLDEAVLSYEKALSIKPDLVHFQSMLRLGYLYVYQNRYDDARAAFQRAITGGNADLRSQARAILPLISLYQGKLTQASMELDDAFAADRIENAAAVSPGSAAFKYFVRSRIMLAKGDFNAAAKALREALPLAEQAGTRDQDSYSIHYAHALALAGDLNGAQRVVRELADRVTRRGDNLDPLHKAEGLVAFASGDYEYALDRLSRIADPDWKGFDTRYVLARAYLNLDQYEAAEREFNEALADYSDRRRLSNALASVEAYYYLALAEEQLGETASAIEHHEELLRIWKNADSSLGLVDQAREKLSRLKSSS